MSRAGWPGGKLSAPKLFQSVSISGPSATVKPMPTKTSSSCSIAWVTRWRWPKPALDTDLGEIEPFGLEPGGAICGRDDVANLGRRLGDGGPGLVERLAGIAAGVGVERAEALSELGQRRLLAQQLALDGAELVERGRRP